MYYHSPSFSDGLLTDLKQSLPPGRGPNSQSVTGTPLPASADLCVPTELPGSEDFHERREFTSPDHRTHTVEERSRRTERLDGGVSQQDRGGGERRGREGRNKGKGGK